MAGLVAGPDVAGAVEFLLNQQHPDGAVDLSDFTERHHSTFGRF